METEKILTYTELIDSAAVKKYHAFYLVSPESVEDDIVPQWHFEYLFIDNGVITSWAENAHGDPEYVDVENEDSYYKDLFFLKIEKDNPVYNAITNFIDNKMYPEDTI